VDTSTADSRWQRVATAPQWELTCGAAAAGPDGLAAVERFVGALVFAGQRAGTVSRRFVGKRQIPRRCRGLIATNALGLPLIHTSLIGSYMLHQVATMLQVVSQTQILLGRQFPIVATIRHTIATSPNFVAHFLLVLESLNVDLRVARIVVALVTGDLHRVDDHKRADRGDHDQAKTAVATALAPAPIPAGLGLVPRRSAQPLAGAEHGVAEP
jgi:hypothetical protein